MSRTRPLTALVLTAGLALTVTACGDDEDDTTTTEAPAATAAPTPTVGDTSAPGTSSPAGAPAAGDTAAFCAAELEIEAAVNSEGDPTEAIAAATAVAPADVQPAFTDLVAAFGAGGPESPEFSAAYDSVITWMSENCGFTVIDATATEYAYAGVPEEIPAGPTIINMTNLGDEFHEFILFRKADGVTDSALDIVALPEEEMMSKASFAAAAFGPPDAVAHGVAELAAGEYFAICFLPENATPEVMAQMEGPESSLPEGAGPPHFTHGMVVEFTVTG